MEVSPYLSANVRIKLTCNPRVLREKAGKLRKGKIGCCVIFGC